MDGQIKETRITTETKKKIKDNFLPILLIPDNLRM